jgi:5-oxoprolinase (ATP-hydrolysing)
MAARRLAIDIGGTFTDVAIRAEDGTISTFKVSSDPAQPARAVGSALASVAAAGGDRRWEHVLHGTTVGTNALLQHLTPPAALITTAGFRDVLQIGRLKRPNLYSIGWSPLQPLIPRDRIFEISERRLADGSVRTPMRAENVKQVVESVRACGVQSVAICLLHSYRNDSHEQAIAAAIRGALPGVHVTVSAGVDGDISEFERMSTTVIHAVLKPVLSEYVRELEAIVRVDGGQPRMLVMQSNGGLASAEQIVERPALAVESGPAAGALLAGQVALAAGIDQAIAFDMGGTTAKACLLENGAPAENDNLQAGAEMHSAEGFSGASGYTIRGRFVDLVEVGAGGGSLCQVDRQGVLHVGPQSAGADPGPVAYGRGGEVPTVTDANLVLGYLPQGVASDVELDPERARNAIMKQVGEPLGIGLDEAAWLIFQVANSNMIRALQAVSSERGREPAEYTLIAFGGGGPTHASTMAAELGMRRVLIPPGADCFSAVGLHTCAVRHDVRAQVGCRADAIDPGELARIFDDLNAGAREQLKAQGFGDVHTRRVLDACFLGQNSVLSVDVGDLAGPDLREQLTRRFVERHLAEYGHADADAPVLIVAARVFAEARLDSGIGRVVTVQPAQPELAGDAYFGPEHGRLDVRRIGIDMLQPGVTVAGPVLIQTGQATAVVPPGACAERDATGTLVISLEARQPGTLPGGGWEGRAGLQLFRNALGSIIDRMAYTLARTAYSSMASDANDFSVAIGDGSFRVLDQGAGVLIHLGSVSTALEALTGGDLDELAPGDVILLNDPFQGGTHLPDLIVVVPVFAGGRRVAFSVAIAHMIDIGGLVSGSFSAGATELLQEGLVIPPVKLYSAGVPNRAVFDIVRRNVRQAAEVIGDLHGLVAAARAGESRIQELLARTGVAASIDLMRQLIQYGRERGQAELSELGMLQAHFVDYLDGDGVTDNPVRIEVDLRIAGGEVWADFTGSSPQVRAGINAPISASRSVLQYCMRTQMTADFPDNAGLHELLHIIAEEGSVVSAGPDAPVANRGMTAFRMVDAVFGAMAQMLPGRIWAAGDGSLDPLTIGGRRPDGSRFTVVDIVGGTTGARPWSDGAEGVAPPIGNAKNHSVEMLESRFPLLVTRYGFAPGTGGQGRFRGGNAIVRSYELLCDEAQVSVRSDRKKFRAWGLAGGEPGAPSKNTLVRDGAETELPSKHVFTMLAGDQLTRQGAGGGGYGPVAERPAELSERDRREGRTI